MPVWTTLLDAFQGIRARLPAVGGSSDAADALPVIHRLAIIYLMLPVAIWLLGWFEWWFGIPAAALLAAGLWRALCGSWRAPVTPAAVVLLLFALGCVMVTAYGGLFDVSGGDQRAHRAVLLDLGRGGWPTYLTDYLHDAPPLLRYYLGWYLPPALAGKWLGPAALNWAVPLWTWGGLALIVLLFTRGLPTLRAMLLAATVLITFSGMDALEYALHEGLPDAARLLRDKLGEVSLSFIQSPTSPMFLEYQSHAQTFKVTPQHFITGGLATLLIIRLRRQPRFLAVSGIVLAACLFWSSLLSLGLLPLAAALLVKNGIRPFLKWQNVLVALPLAALLALYLTSGKIDFATGWLWEAYPGRFQLAADLFIFYAGEFAVLALLLWRLHPRVIREPFFIASVAVLLVAPWFWYGGPNFSELTLRVVVPALFVLSYYAAHTLAGRLPELAAPPAPIAEIGAAKVGGDSSRPALALLVIVLSVGAVSAMFEFAILISNPGPLPYERTDNSLLIDSTSWAALQRTTRDIPVSLQTLLRKHDDKGGPKGDLVISSKYDVYLNASRLIYVNRNCSLDDEDSRWFFLHVYPVDPDDLPEHRKRYRYDELDFRFSSFYHYKYDGNCVAAQRLPDYDIARIHTGQFIPAAGRVWEAGFNLETGEPVNLSDAYRSEYRAIVSGEPLIRSHFDVYLGAGVLNFVKEPCGPGDTEPTFVVHVMPADANDLPDHRKQYGFDNLDFHFSPGGVRFDEKCLARQALPDYDIVHIRVGQWIPAANRTVWSEEYSLRE